MKKKETDIRARSTNRRRANEPSLQRRLVSWCRRRRVSFSPSSFISLLSLFHRANTHTYGALASIVCLSSSTALRWTLIRATIHIHKNSQWLLWQTRIHQRKSFEFKTMRKISYFDCVIFMVRWISISFWHIFTSFLACLGNDYKKYGEYIKRESSVPLTIKKIYKLLDERKAYRRISDYFHRER